MYENTRRLIILMTHFLNSVPSRAVSDGYWVILEPLPPGKHDIHFKVSLTNPTIGILFYSDDLKYTVNVANITSPNWLIAKYGLASESPMKYLI
jgi:hypothetical protein